MNDVKFMILSLGETSKTWPTADQIPDEPYRWCRFISNGGTDLEFIVKHDGETARRMYETILGSEMPSRIIIRKRVERKGGGVLVIAY